MNVTADATAIEQFFETILCGGVDDGFVALFHTPSRLTTWVPANDPKMIAATVASLDQIGNVYFGVGIQPKALGPYQRGTAATVSALLGLHVDIDLAGGEHVEQALPRSTRDVADLLRAAIALVPSLVIHSGGGTHCYWLFHEPWILENEEERKRAARLNNALQLTIIVEAAKRGWKIESTADLARVFRPAGTANRKRPDAPVPVRTIHNGGERYGIEQLEFYLPAEQDVFRSRPSGPVAEHAPIAMWSHIIGKCGYLKHCVDDAVKLDEPSWHAAMTIIARCRDGETIAHRVSQNYPRYDQDETDKKFAYSVKADAPLRCSTIRHHRGGEPWCSQCVLWGTIASPIVLGMPPGYIIRRPTAATKEAAGA